MDALSANQEEARVGWRNCWEPPLPTCEQSTYKLEQDTCTHANLGLNHNNGATTTSMTNASGVHGTWSLSVGVAAVLVAFELCAVATPSGPRSGGNPAEAQQPLISKQMASADARLCRAAGVVGDEDEPAL